MLGTTLWLVAVGALLTAAILDGAAAFARAGVRAAAEHAIEAVLQDALTDYQRGIASRIAQTAPASELDGTTTVGGTIAPAQLAQDPVPYAVTVTPPPAAAGEPPGPRFTLSYTVTPHTVAPPSCVPPGSASSGTDTVASLQCSAFVDESRMALQITATVRDAAGAALAERVQLVTLRVFAEPPYSAVVGREDESAAGAAGSAAASGHEGDAGSSAPIGVRYRCLDAAPYACAGHAFPPDPDGARAAVPWTNGNARL